MVGMFTKDAEEKKLLELRELKRKNRRRNGMMLLVAFQVTSIILTYYLGRTSHNG